MRRDGRVVGWVGMCCMGCEECRLYIRIDGI